MKQRDEFLIKEQKFETKINNLKSELQTANNTIGNIDYILKKYFGVTHDCTKTLGEFEKILSDKIESSKTITNFFPAEPIKAVDMLIQKFHEPSRASCGAYEEMFKQENKMLRQIAEHLLIYCNNQKGE